MPFLSVSHLATPKPGGLMNLLVLERNIILKGEELRSLGMLLTMRKLEFLGTTISEKLALLIRLTGRSS